MMTTIIIVGARFLGVVTSKVSPGGYIWLRIGNHTLGIGNSREPSTRLLRNRQLFLQVLYSCKNRIMPLRAKGSSAQLWQLLQLQSGGKLDDGWPESETCDCPALWKRYLERELKKGWT